MRRVPSVATSKRWNRVSRETRFESLIAEQTLRFSHRLASPDVGAVLLAMLIAPIGPLALNVVVGLWQGKVLVTLGRLMSHPAMADVLSWVGAIWLDPKWMALHACLVAWLGVVPAMMLLRVFGRLTFSTALPAGAILPLSTVSAVTLLMWNATSAGTGEKFTVYGVLVASTVPAALAAAATFWGVYAWAGGGENCFARSEFKERDLRST